MRVLLWIAAIIVTFVLVVVTKSFPWQAPAEGHRIFWDALGLLVVNGGVGVVQYLLNRWRPRKGQLFFGVYSILGPLGLWAWLSDPEVWFVVPFALIGVTVLWGSGAPAEAGSPEPQAQ